MSDILYDMLVKKYPPTPRGYQRITTYPHGGRSTWIERIHCDLIEKIFFEENTRGKLLVKPGEIEDIAKNMFESIEFRFLEHTTDGTVIIFSPNSIDDYSRKYNGHYIAIGEPLRKPYLTISTGNRGSIALHEKQRENYFKFINSVYDLFVKKVKDI